MHFWLGSNILYLSLSFSNFLSHIHTYSTVLFPSLSFSHFLSGDLMGDTVALLSFYPENKAVTSSCNASSNEFIFLMDCSGSMGRMNQGKHRIDTAKVLPPNLYFYWYLWDRAIPSLCKISLPSYVQESLLLLLKSLPIGCLFNVYSFGSTHTSFFPWVAMTGMAMMAMMMMIMITMMIIDYSSVQLELWSTFCDLKLL